MRDEPDLVHREIRKAVPCHHQAIGIRHERNVREEGIPTESIQDLNSNGIREWSTA